MARHKGIGDTFRGLGEAGKAAVLPQAWKIRLVDQCSCEGLAKFIFDEFDKMVSDATSARVCVVAVEVSEDKKNTARYAVDAK